MSRVSMLHSLRSRVAGWKSTNLTRLSGAVVDMAAFAFCMVSMAVAAWESQVVRDFVDEVFSAIGRAGLSDKEAAADMGMDTAQLSRVRSGNANLTMAAFARLPKSVHQWFAIGVARRVGLPAEVQVGKQLEGAL